jgi:nucleoid-associated protein YgaU
MLGKPLDRFGGRLTLASSGSPVVGALLATVAALAIAIATTAATTEVAATAATEAATATAAAATEAATAAAAATEAATATAAAAEAAAAAATEAATRTRSPRLGLIHHEGAALEVLAIEVLDGGLARLLGTHGHEAEAARAARLAVGSDEHIQHLSVSREDFAKAVWRRTIVEISDKELEHVWPPRPGLAASCINTHVWLNDYSTRSGLTVSGAVNRAAYRVSRLSSAAYAEIGINR